MTQLEFHWDGPKGCAAETDPTAMAGDGPWWVPFGVLRPAENKKNLVVTWPSPLVTCAGPSPDPSLSLGADDPNDWLVLNPGQAGFYRVNYPTDLWNRLARAVGRGEVPTTEAANLVDDADALNAAGMLPPAVPLALAAAVGAPARGGARNGGGADYEAVAEAMGVLEGALVRVQVRIFRTSCRYMKTGGGASICGRGPPHGVGSKQHKLREGF